MGIAVGKTFPLVLLSTWRLKDQLFLRVQAPGVPPRALGRGCAPLSLKLATGPQPDLSAAPRALQGSLVLGSQLLASWAAPRMPARGASLVTSSNMRWSEAPAQVLTLALQAPRALHVILLSLHTDLPLGRVALWDSCR